MEVPPDITSLIEQLQQELSQCEHLSLKGLNTVKQILVRFPDNARMVELFAVLNNVLYVCGNIQATHSVHG